MPATAFDHKSQCRHLYGHRYAIEITLTGSVIDRAGDPANGMVMDFSEVKSPVKAHVERFRTTPSGLPWRPFRG